MRWVIRGWVIELSWMQGAMVEVGVEVGVEVRGRGYVVEGAW